MERLILILTITSAYINFAKSEETVLSSVLAPTNAKDADSNNELLKRQSRSYYDYRYGAPRPLYDRLEYARYDYDRPRCGRCDDRYDDDDYDRHRDRDDDRSDRRSHKPTSGSRHDRNRNSDSDEDDRRYNDRNNGQKNGTEEENGNDDKKRPYDDKDSRPSGSRRGSSSRDRERDRDRDRYDDRDRYRPDYYDRFLRDPYRERDYAYRERRPLFDRYPYEETYPSRYDGYGSSGYGRPGYIDRGYSDSFGGYGPGIGQGSHDRPWDETYRGQAGWDAGGRGYYFASGRPDAAPASAWQRPEYSRPSDSGWQNVGYTSGYRDPIQYRGSSGYSADGYRQDPNSVYGQSSGWRNVGERRPYRDQSGVAQLDSRPEYGQSSRNTNTYGQSNRLQSAYDQPNLYGQATTYGQQAVYGQQTAYGQQSTYGQKSTYGQPNAYSPTNIGQTVYSSTTPGSSYLFARDDELVTVKDEETNSTSAVKDV